jgi:hypothetical protein
MDNNKLALIKDITKKIINDSATEAEKAKAEGKTYRLRFGLAPRLNPEARLIFRGAFEDETLAKFCNRMAEEGRLMKDFVGYKPSLTGAVEIKKENGFTHYKLVRNNMESIIKIEEKTGMALTPIYYFEEFVPDWIKKKINQKMIAKTAMLLGQKWYNENVQNKLKDGPVTIDDVNVPL